MISNAMGNAPPTGISPDNRDENIERLLLSLNLRGALMEYRLKHQGVNPRLISEALRTAYLALNYKRSGLDSDRVLSQDAQEALLSLADDEVKRYAEEFNLQYDPDWHMMNEQALPNPVAYAMQPVLARMEDIHNEAVPATDPPVSRQLFDAD